MLVRLGPYSSMLHQRMKQSFQVDEMALEVVFLVCFVDRSFTAMTPVVGLVATTDAVVHCTS